MKSVFRHQSRHGTHFLNNLSIRINSTYVYTPNRILEWFEQWTILLHQPFCLVWLEGRRFPILWWLHGDNKQSCSTSAEKSLVESRIPLLGVKNKPLAAVTNCCETRNIFFLKVPKVYCSFCCFFCESICERMECFLNVTLFHLRGKSLLSKKWTCNRSSVSWIIWIRREV